MDERLRRWLDALLATPGLTSISDLDEARRVHVDESLSAVEVLRRFEGPIVDVGSGGGAPGIPLAAALPEREVTLLEANGRKCAFLRDAARAFPNVAVVQGRAEEQETDRFGVAVAKALAPPPVARLLQPATGQEIGTEECTIASRDLSSSGCQRAWRPHRKSSSPGGLSPPGLPGISRLVRRA